MFGNRENSLHLPHFTLPANRELRQFYAFLAIYYFSLGLVGLFVPIYLYLFFGNSLSLVFLFLAVRYFTVAVLAPFSARFPSRIGIKHTFLLSIPMFFLYLFGLWNIEFLGGFVFILALLSGMQAALFWPAYHMFFARFSDKGKTGRELSYGSIVLSLVTALAPFVGGIIITYLGFNMLFVIALAFAFASAVPLFLSEEAKEEYSDSYGRAIRHVFEKKYRRAALAFASRGIEMGISLYVWPLFLFIIAIDFAGLGIIESASLIVGMVFLYYIGRKSDEVGHEKVMAVGILLNAIFWPLKALVRAPLDAFSIDTLHRFGMYSARLPFSAMFYEWAGKDQKSRDSMVVFWEIITSASRGILFLSLFAIFAFTDNLRIIFLFAPIFALGYILIVRDLSTLKKDLTKRFARQHRELDVPN